MVTIYHNPRCSKSRTTLSLLQEQSIEPQVIEYLKTPPDTEKLKEILSLLGLTARELMRKGESKYSDLGLDNRDLTEDELIAAMVENPILIERPIVLANNKAIIGRPPEGVLDIL